MLPIALVLIPAAGAKEEVLEPAAKAETIVVSTEPAKIEQGADGIGGLAVCPTSAAPEILTSGVASAIGNDTTTADCHYKINVANPVGMRLRAVVTWVGNSDHDVMVKFNTPATVSPYYCSETGVSQISPSQCTSTAALSAGDYYIRVKRWNGFAEFTLTVFIEVPPPTCSFTGTADLLAGVARSDSLTADTGANCQYKFTPGSELAFGDLARVTLTSPVGSNFDLYLKRGSAPTTSSYDCRSILTTTGGTDTCSVDATADVFVMVIRTSGSGAFNVVADQISSCGLGPGVHPLAAGVNSGSLLGLTGAKCYFEYDPSSSVDFARYVLPPTTPNDFDMYVKSGAIPTTTSYDCRPYLGGSSTETCDLLVEGPQFVMVRRFSGVAAGGSFTLNVTEVIVPVLENGIPVAGVAAQGVMTYYKVVVPGTNELGVAPSQLALVLGGDPSALACAEAGAAADADVCGTAVDSVPTCASAVEPVAPGTCAGVADANAEACAALGGCPAAPPAPALFRDADLYVRHARGLPTTSLYDCRPYEYGSTEACVFSNEAASTRASAASNFTAVANEVRNAIGPTTCVDPTIPESCVSGSVVPNTLPAAPGAVVVPFKGAGRYFVGIRGFAGPADYVITALFA